METKNGDRKAPAANAVGVLITILGGCLWGFSGACGQYLFEQKGMTSKWLVPVRLIAAGFIMLFYYVIRERGRAFRIWRKRRDAVDVIVYGVAGLMLCQYTYFTTIELSNAGTATVIQYIAPAIVLVLVCLMERRFPKAVEVTALVLAIVGIFLIATHGDIRHMALSPKALTIGLFSAVTVVIYNLQPRRLMAYYSTSYLLAWGMVIGGILLAFIFKPWSYTYHPDAGFLLALASIIILGTMVAFSLYMQGVKMIGPERASLYACVEPIASTLLTVFWLKAPFTGMDFAGFACIIATILLLGYSDLKKAEKR